MSSRSLWSIIVLGVLLAGAGATWSVLGTRPVHDLLRGSSRAPELMRRYGCAGCHRIDGVPAARGLVGPSLVGVANRIYLGGVVPNSRENMVSWIVDPRAFSPKTAMPVTGISESEAREVAAYLYGHAS